MLTHSRFPKGLESLLAQGRGRKTERSECFRLWPVCTRFSFLCIAPFADPRVGESILLKRIIPNALGVLAARLMYLIVLLANDVVKRFLRHRRVVANFDGYVSNTFKKAAVRLSPC